MTHPLPSGTRVGQARPPAETYAIESAPAPEDRYPGKMERIKATLLKLRPGSDDSFVPECTDNLVYQVAKRIGVKVVSKPASGKTRRFWRLK
jgi:hypothetical protein